MNCIFFMLTEQFSNNLYKIFLCKYLTLLQNSVFKFHILSNGVDLFVTEETVESSVDVGVDLE